jgi:hypothetical protein
LASVFAGCGRGAYRRRGWQSRFRWPQPITPPGGQLKCDVSGGLSYIIGSSRALDCVYTPDGFPPEYYTGRINKIGIDVGFQRRGVIVWAVLSPGLTRGPGALTGNYVGLSADVAAGLGAGANALIGGNKVVLQPVSVSGNIGINLAAGIGDISLTYVDRAIQIGKSVEEDKALFVPHHNNLAVHARIAKRASDVLPTGRRRSRNQF